MVNFRYNKNKLALLCCVIVTILSGCQNEVDFALTQDTVLLVTSTPNLSPVPITETATPVKSTATLNSAVIPTKPESTNTPSLTPEPTTIARPTIDKLLLISVYEDITGLSREEIWILRPGENTPQLLLGDDTFSFSSPQWSNSGKLVAYLKHKKTIPDNVQIGVIETENIKLLSKEFRNIDWLEWSADDYWLTFTTLSPDTGISPFAIELETETVRNLHPNPDTHYTRDIMKSSPHDNLVLFAGLINEPSQSVEIWLIPIDNRQVPVPVDFEMPPECDWITDIEWAPDGKSFLLQPGTISDDYECWPRIFSYSLVDQEWSELVRAPDENQLFVSLHWFNWSPDRKWLAWNSSFMKNALILDTETWDVVTNIDFKGIRGFPNTPWVQNSIEQSVLSIVESSYSEDYSTKYLVYGIELKQSTEEILIMEMAPESEWLPEGMRSYPYCWQP